MFELPPGWVELPPSKYHPGKHVFEGPCDVCGKTIRRSDFHLRTRARQLCSKKCLGKALEPARDSVRWLRGRAFVYRPDHPNPPKRKKATGYVLRSHTVMEDFLGRYLTESEIVHHKNEDPTDDRLENLELTDRSAHRAHHAAEEIAKYGTTARWK